MPELRKLIDRVDKMGEGRNYATASNYQQAYLSKGGGRCMLQPVRHTLGGARWALTHGSCSMNASQRFRAFQLKSALIAKSESGATEPVLLAVAADPRWYCLVAAALGPAALLHLVQEQANIDAFKLCSNALCVREGRAHQWLLLPFKDVNCRLARGETVSANS